VSETAFDQWAILEIMGHNRFAGRLTEETIAGKGFLRIDIPSVGGREGFTKFFGPDSVYAITPCTEDVAAAVAAELRNEPIGVYDLPEDWRRKLQRLPAPGNGTFDEDDYEDEDGVL